MQRQANQGEKQNLNYPQGGYMMHLHFTNPRGVDMMFAVYMMYLHVHRQRNFNLATSKLFLLMQVIIKLHLFVEIFSLWPSFSKYF